MKHEKVKKILEKEFEKLVLIDDTKLIFGQSEYYIKAHLEEYPDFSFSVNLDRKTHKIKQTSYPRLFWGYEIKQKFTNKTKSNLGRFALEAIVYTNLEYNVDLKALPSVEEIIAKDSEAKLELRCHLFKDISGDKNIEILQNIIETTNWFLEMNFSEVYCHYSFYDEAFFKDQDINSFNYGFTNLAKGLFEFDYKDNLNSNVIFQVKQSSDKLTIETLKSIIDFNPNYLISSTNYL